MAKTSLSAGIIIRDILTKDADVMNIARKVFPVVTDKAELPYVAYRRTRFEHNAVKGQNPGADSVFIEVDCFAKTYEKSIELAEAVRAGSGLPTGRERRPGYAQLHDGRCRGILAG